MFDLGRTAKRKQAEENSQSPLLTKDGDVDTTITYRKWGYYRVLHEADGYSVKELVILPGRTLSDQKHAKRDEHWLVVSGQLDIDVDYMVGHGVQLETLEAGESYDIGSGVWHRPHNTTEKNVVVIETWLGNSTEEDIERR
jgi:mannose-6-phosphate isomerase-like protein (cupin superfamily)